jgi:hypothetical protein
MSVSQHPIDSVTKPEALAWSEHLEQWRSAAKRVGRAWEEWLAADETERDWAHEVYLGALAHEEAAALRLERDARGLREPSP